MAEPKIPQPDTKTIRIESMLGGQTKYVNYAAGDQFLHSYNIDPDVTNVFNQSEGVISPTGVKQIGVIAALNGAPKWIVPIPRLGGNVQYSYQYVYDAAGSVYTLDIGGAGGAQSGLTDLNDGGTASGNGAAYYDNYLYAARDTTVARYGPLNGTPSWTDDYWASTLGKTALSNTTYPYYADSSTIRIPNHVMLRHNDGKLYFADVVGNQGYLHYIRTSKTTVEGDTDNGSTYLALQFPYGFYPTAMAGYGSDIAVALYEGSNDPVNFQKRAKLSFWDTTSQNYNLITEVEFPDQIIYALLNTNGVLYAFSGQVSDASLGYKNPGVRVTRFTGGYTFEQVGFIDYAYPPMAGAVDGYLNRILFGGQALEPSCIDASGNTIPNGNFMRGGVWSIGSKKSPINSDIYHIMGSTNTAAANKVTALKIAGLKGMQNIIPVAGWSNDVTHGTDFTNFGQLTLFSGSASSSFTSTGPASAWRSQVYRVGKRFKIKRIKIPFTQRFTAQYSMIVGIRRDSFDPSVDYVRVGDFIGGATESLNALTIRPDGLTGETRFLLELIFPGTTSESGASYYPRVGFPIEIEIETYDD